MGRPENYFIGRDGEERVKALLYEAGCEIEEGEPNGYPDFIFTRGTVRWGAECKTMRGVHSGGSVGMAKVSREEFHGVCELRQNGLKPCMIVEVRPRGFKEKDYLYVFVPWRAVEGRFKETRPEQVSLSLWWVMRNGMNLEWWLA